MPPVHKRITRQSRAKRNQKFVSRARGRGRRRNNVVAARPPNPTAIETTTTTAVVNAAGGATNEEPEAVPHNPDPSARDPLSRSGELDSTFSTSSPR